MTRFEEWRVTGDFGDDLPPYESVFSPLRDDECTDPEAEARRLMQQMASASRLVSGPHLHKRTVTVTKWRPA